MNIVFYSFLLLLLIAIYQSTLKPLFTLIKYKVKYGERTRIFFMPIIGAFYFSDKSLSKDGDCMKWGKDEVAKTKGKIDFISMNVANQPYIGLVNPEMIQDFLVNQEDFTKMQIPQSHLLLRQGLLFTDGALWKRQRNFLAVHFNFESLRQRVPLIISVVTKYIGINDSLSGPPIKLVHFFEQITSEVIQRTFLSNDLRDQQIDGVPIIQLLNQTMIQGLNIMNNPFFALKYIFMGLETALYKFQRNEERTLLTNAAQLRTLMTEVIYKRINDYKSGQISQNPNSDFLDIYIEEILKNEREPRIITSDDLKLDVDQIVDTFFVFYFAGTDSTAVTVALTLNMLANNPESEDQLRMEINSVLNNKFENLEPGHLNQMIFLQAVISETLRLNGPINFLVPRIAKRNVKIRGLEIPQGSFVNAFNFMNMYDPNNFENPEKFFPERWLWQKKGNLDAHAYLPFSGGPRNCIGQHMALMEVKIILIHVLMIYKLSRNPSIKLRVKMASLLAPEDDRLVIFTKI